MSETFLIYFSSKLDMNFVPVPSIYNRRLHSKIVSIFLKNIRSIYIYFS